MIESLLLKRNQGLPAFFYQDLCKTYVSKNCSNNLPWKKNFFKHFSLGLH